MICTPWQFGMGIVAGFASSSVLSSALRAARASTVAGDAQWSMISEVLMRLSGTAIACGIVPYLGLQAVAGDRWRRRIGE